MLSMRSHSDSKGFELKRPNDSIYTFPCPDCMCHTNKTEDAKPSTPTWSAWRLILWIFLVPVILIPFTDPLFCVGILSFFSHLHRWRGHTINFGSSEDFVWGHIDLIYFPGLDCWGEFHAFLYILEENRAAIDLSSSEVSRS